MMDFMKAFATQLREKQKLEIRLGVLDSDPLEGNALIGSFSVFQPSAGESSSPELSTVKLYNDLGKSRLFVEITCPSKEAMDLVHPAISPAITTAIDTIDVTSFELPIVIARSMSYLDTSDPKLKGEFWSNPYMI